MDADRHLDLARASLRKLLADHRVPEAVREELANEYAQVETLLGRLEHEQIHLAFFGRVSVGKSALINALLGEERFSTSPLHGETVEVTGARWTSYADGNVILMDTPGIDEVEGEARERLATELAAHSDLVVFVLDGDITATELDALHELAEGQNQIILVLNKTDRYNDDERLTLLTGLRERTAGLVMPNRVIDCSAAPPPKTVIRIDESGVERDTLRATQPDIDALRTLLWQTLDAEGKSLAAVNAGLFAGTLTERVSLRIVEVRREVAERVIRNFALGKGIGVALNPVPVADLLALAADGAMVVRLSKVYGLPVTRAEAGRLIRVIAAQLTLLMGTVWTVSLASSALKGVSMGLSTLVTAGAQGSVAYYGTYVVGRAASRYFANGGSWGSGGAKRAVRQILDDVDGDTVLAQAREDIIRRIRGQSRSQR